MNEFQSRLIDVLDQALEAELGIVLRTTDPVRLRARLYAARRAAGGGRYAGLQIRMLSDNRMAITKGRAPEGVALQLQGPGAAASPSDDSE